MISDIQKKQINIAIEAFSSSANNSKDMLVR